MIESLNPPAEDNGVGAYFVLYWENGEAFIWNQALSKDSAELAVDQMIEGGRVAMVVQESAEFDEGDI